MKAIDAIRSNTTALKTSGVNSVIIFGIGILADGGIMYYSNTPGSKDTLVASNGAYVGGSALSEKVRSFKINNTSIDRIEVSTNAQHIKDLMAKPGTGNGTPLAKNFKALKEAWGLDAVNNDDESIYDLASTVSFAKMLESIGLKYTIAPYTNPTFWNSVRSQVNSGRAEGDWILDRVYLQCYDGGSGNNPATWQKTLGMNVVPLVWVTNDSKPSYGTTAAQAKSRFTAWKQAGGLAGGGYWNDYDIEKMKSSYKEYGDVLKSVFP
ncbi:hypothetical protein BCR34DRAFT_677325 [Clohesyomyces aquaticus]|uniref:Coagulation factor 5/8 type domain-containing protein n=1 Tax=Clohesyomyces aquaticus TaxID=1231657 RepID=A0A1Y1YEU4_9PLEO|nr:hypothetical protein BCR34DRAFT_677325 [Clohesyomyces aquaticus]